MQTTQHFPGFTIACCPGAQSGSGHLIPSQGSLQIGQHCHAGMMNPSFPQSGISHTIPSHDVTITFCWP